MLLIATSQAQTQAYCSFTFFPTILSSPSAQLFPAGVNDFGTVVGSAFTTSPTGYIEWGNGGFIFPAGTSAIADRNDKGVSIGNNSFLNAFVLIGSTVTPISVVIGSNTIQSFDVEGINNWGSIVGWYTDSAGVTHGFKRWNNGNGIALDYPAQFSGPNSGTFPTAINDKGVIVGSTQSPYHAFIYHNGQWATLQYPNAVATLLSGISNDGVIVGNAQLADGSNQGFLYKNGVFQAVSPPNTSGLGVGSGVIGISLRNGIILGFADFANSPRQGYVAGCI
jgi:probable HAF family extracellular repeat protein